MMRKPFSFVKRNGVWYAIFPIPGSGRKIISTGVQVSGDNPPPAALKFATDWINKKNPTKVTLQSFVDDVHFFVWNECLWIQSQHAQGRPFSRAVARSRRAHLTTYVLPRFGKYKLSEIKASMLRDWLLTIKLKNATKNHIRSTLSIVFAEAVFRDLIEHNIVLNIHPFSKDYRKRDIFTDAEIRSLFPVDREGLLRVWAEPFWYTFFFAMMSTGIRLGEARGLIWGNVRFEEHALTITQAVKAFQEIGKPKSREERALFLPNRTLELLREWHNLTKHNSINDLIFPGRNGLPMEHRTPWLHFITGLKNAGVSREGRNLVIHSMRHTYNTKMRQLISEQALRLMVGHTDVKMTDRYDGLTALDKLKTLLPDRSKVDDAWN